MSSVTNKCVLCGQNFPSKDDLKDHFRCHANDTSLPNTRLIKPVQSTTTSTVTCDECDMKFTSMTIAIKHKHKAHPDCQTRFFCQQCGKYFPLKASLEKHKELEHSTEDSSKLVLVCQQCKAEFSNPSALAFHVKSSHKRVIKLVYPTETQPPSKKIMVNNSGEAASAYYCHLCGTEYMVKYNPIFYNEKAYSTHNLYHTPDDLYVIDEAHRLETISKVDQDYDAQRVVHKQRKTMHVKLPAPKVRALRKQTEEPSGGTKRKLGEEEECKKATESILGV